MSVSTELAALLLGLWVTFQLVLLSTLFGVVLALPVTMSRLSASTPVSVLGFVWSGFFRGTPLLVQLFLVYYGLAQFSWIRHSFVWPVLRDGYSCALLTLSLNMSGYVSEVLRGGIMAVPRGEREAAQALGMSGAMIYRRIILPRAFRIMLPALSNEMVVQLKSSALVSTVTVLDLTGVARRLADKSYSLEPLIMAGAIYVILTFSIARAVAAAERRFVRH